MQTVAQAAPAWTPRDASAPAAAALLPQWIARLLGFAALASLGALEWQRQIAGLSSGRALLWVLAAVGTGAAVVAAERVRPPWPRALALTGAAVGGALAGFVASGAALRLLDPRHWSELVSGVAGGVRSLGTVRLPYAAYDPWPRVALELLGAELLVAAALLAMWPRARERGFPFISLAALLVLVAAPVISLGGARPLLLGVVLAALTVCFLWLERLPLRPGIGVAALLGLALAGALPLASFADRGEPWFDYTSFAEGLGPNDPAHFSWAQGYGPITWPRDGNEVMRVKSPIPMYWKARDLDDFDGRGWRVRSTPTPPLHASDPSWVADVPEAWGNHPEWTSTLDVSVRRMRMPDVIGAGTIMGVQEASKDVRPGLASGTWDVQGGQLQRGDSYQVHVHAPKPDGAQLSEASSGANGAQADDLVLHVPFRGGLVAPGIHNLRTGAPLHSADVHFRGWDDQESTAYASYPTAQRSEFDIDRVMRRSKYARTWALSKRLRRGAKTAFDYVIRVNHFLQRPDFRYSERPTPPAPGREPLDAFVNDTHEGYCQHYAGAMALLLRMGGVPARVATGFTPGGYSKLHGAWVVRDTDAHAWVEAWFDPYGWVTFDPTPDATPARSQIAALVPPPPPAPAPLTAAERAVGSANGRIAAASRLRADLRFDIFQGDRGAEESSGGTTWWPWAVGAAAVLLLIAVAVVAVRRRARRAGTPLERAIAELEQALRRAGRPAPTGTTLRQLERRLGGSPDVVAYLRALSEARYAATGNGHAPDGRRALRRALAEGLGPTGRLRAFWALPPRVR